ncbi:hypothetical protein Hanom_Chr12g01159071 [Helianthus anomalus]
MAKLMRTYAIILCLMFLTLLIGLDSTRVAGQKQYGDNVSTLRNEKIGWIICKYYGRQPVVPYCCCDDQIDCFETKESCIEYCTKSTKMC